MQFRQTEVRDYLVARYLYKNPCDENFKCLSGLEDEQRFAFHGWLLEHVNDDERETDNRKKVRNWLWENDPVLVSLGLFSEKQLKELALPDHPWEPYECGLMKIMRGENVSNIPETREIRDVRLASPEEKLLHRLRHSDLPYFMRAVPNKRVIERLREAWFAVDGTWCDLMPPLAPIAKDLLESKYGVNAPVALYAYGIDQSDDIMDVADQYVTAAINRKFETDILVRLLLLLTDLLARVGYGKKKEQINKGINDLRYNIFSGRGRHLSAKQLHRLLASETHHKVTNGITSQRQWSMRVLEFIYSGDREQPPIISAVKMKPLIVELQYLKPIFSDHEVAKEFTQQLWVQMSEKINSIAPVTLAAAICTRITSLDTLQGNGFLNQWMNYWFGRLSTFEAVLLQRRGIQFQSPPTGFVYADGWLQARDASHLARVRHQGTLPTEIVNLVVA